MAIEKGVFVTGVCFVVVFCLVFRLILFSVAVFCFSFLLCIVLYFVLFSCFCYSSMYLFIYLFISCLNSGVFHILLT